MPEPDFQLLERIKKMRAQSDAPALKGGGGNGTFDDMDRVWEKLAEQDKRFEGIESAMKKVADELGSAKLWFVGTALAIALGSLGLVYAARQDTTATMGTALAAIQTVISHQQTQTAATPPTVIILPPTAQAFSPPLGQAPSGALPMPSPGPKP